MWDHLPPDAFTHVADLLTSTSDRQSARCTCRAWRAALDGHWQRAAFLARPPEEGRFLPSFHSLSWLWPRLRSLDLVELDSPQRAASLLALLTPGSFPCLRRLALSSALGLAAAGSTRECCTGGGQLQQLRLPSLSELRLDGAPALPLGCLPLAHLRQLVALHVCGGAGVAVAVAGAGQPEVLGVSKLTILTQLKDLSLPALDQEERHQLSLLTGLTALSFGARGRGAVGANLMPLAALRALRISLCHRREHFLVLHPAVEWEELAGMEGLTRLEILNWAAGRRNTAPLLSSPIFVWAEQGEAEAHAATLLAGLPQLHSLRITAAFCRLEKQGAAAAAGAGDAAGQAAGAGDAVGPAAGATELGPVLGASQQHCSHCCDEDQGVIKKVVCDARGRWWERREQRLPLQPAGSRDEEWQHAWWQGDVQARLQELFGQNDPSLQRYRQEQLNVQGHINMRPELPQTFDLELCCRLLRGAEEPQAG